MEGSVLVWFREDLRVGDNPALSAAVASGRPVLCLFVLDDGSPGARPLGGASRWWLHGSLDALSTSLAGLNLPLLLLSGPSAEAVRTLAADMRASAIFWNRRHGPERDDDAAIAADLRSRGVAISEFEARLLYDPGDLTTRAGGPHRVFGSFRKAALARGAPPDPMPAPPALDPRRVPEAPPGRGLGLVDLALRPSAPDWAAGLRDTWIPGEPAACERLRRGLEGRFGAYAQARDLPGRDGTSRLSPHLRFGELSPRQILNAAEFRLESGAGPFTRADLELLRNQLLWRDFSHRILAEHPDLATRNLDRRFDAFPWRDARGELEAWQRGRTGYPLVDAGMRQLWATGFMHNRVRMVVGSFLVKHLSIDWRRGEEWFWDTLVDADPANNAAGWQWVAGSGLDAAPYFRIFNPVLQGERHDPEGDYVRRWIPELALLPDLFLHRPWTAPAFELKAAGVRLGEDYPLPIVDHAFARRRALAAYESVRQARR